MDQKSKQGNEVYSDKSPYRVLFTPVPPPTGHHFCQFPVYCY